MGLLSRLNNGLKTIFSSTDRKVFTDPDGVLNPVIFSTLYGITPKFNDYFADVKKIETVFSSPALLKVICMQCDLFSLGKIYVYDENDVEIEDDPAEERFDNPNPFQSRSQFLWDLMFWNMIGNAYCYIDSDIPTNESMKMYFLDNSKMRFPDKILQNSDKLIFSKAGVKDFTDAMIDYVYQDGTKIQIPLSKITILHDLSNGVGNWYKSPSRIDALYKIITNSEVALDATNINIRYTGKFLVSGQQDPNDVSRLPMSEIEKQDIETKVNGKKQVHAVKSMIDIKRFVENLGNLKLPEIYTSQYYLIGSMYGIPKDVMEAYLQNGATYENQEKAVGRHISYTLQPKGNDFFESVGKRWGYAEQGKEICISWDHLPFMQVFEKDRMALKQQQITTFQSMMKLNIPLQEINEFLDTNFSNASYEQPKSQANAGGS